MQPQLLCTCHVLESDELHMGPNSVANLKKAYNLPEDYILTASRKKSLLLSFYSQTYERLHSEFGLLRWSIHDLSHSLCESEKMDSERDSQTLALEQGRSKQSKRLRQE